MSLGALLVAPLQGLVGPTAAELGPLAAIGATALFAAAHGTPPLFCAAFVFTLQGDPSPLVLLLVSACSTALGQRWRGEGWNEHQLHGLVGREP
jgi:H+/Cl- antiporter ClcA